MATERPTNDRNPTANITFAIGGVSCFADSFTVTESSMLRINICAENLAHRKSTKTLCVMLGGIGTSN